MTPVIYGATPLARSLPGPLAGRKNDPHGSLKNWSSLGENWSSLGS